MEEHSCFFMKILFLAVARLSDKLTRCQSPPLLNLPNPGGLFLPYYAFVGGESDSTGQSEGNFPCTTLPRAVLCGYDVGVKCWEFSRFHAE